MGIKTRNKKPPNLEKKTGEKNWKFGKMTGKKPLILDRDKRGKLGIRKDNWEKNFST